MAVLIGQHAAWATLSYRPGRDFRERRCATPSQQSEPAIIVLAACLAPATAFADEAVSSGGGDIEAGDQVYLGSWDGTPIAWDVEGASDGSAAVHSHYILFNAMIDSRPNPDIAPGLTLEASELYTSTLPNFKSSAFGGGESAIPGNFALSGDFDGATRPDDSGEWYWISEPIYENLDTTRHDWSGWAVDPSGGRGTTSVVTDYGVRPASSFDLSSVLFPSAAEGGKSGAAGAGNFSALSDTSSVSAWKFTLKDSSRSISASATGTTAAKRY